ncbi:hypothetical protein [Rhodococcus sp. IEGM 1379]|uniref:hypothetical protein n=1 Tax=Rhodococcus sp. IEGM 1379 TaxID=3047086 RepID=UPI0024B7F873|nr:hypothetical protein [Rhodococcus sp. IEGM 1379]MDI9914647.1 hypothetical protein [Rhodococcus sp. IEGM 1379]
MSASDTALVVLKRSRISFLRFTPYGPVVTINGRTEIRQWGEYRLAVPDTQPLSTDVGVKG